MASSSNMATSAMNGNTSTHTRVNSFGSRRRPSQEGNALFSGLMAYKRNSEDEGLIARRLSYHETHTPSSVLGKIWHNYTRGGPITTPPKTMSPPPTQL